MVDVENGVAIEKDGRPAAPARHEVGGGGEGFRDADIDEEPRVWVTAQRPGRDQFRKNVAFERARRARSRQGRAA